MTPDHQPMADKVDWEHYRKHKTEIDELANKELEKGTLQNMGHPPGPTLEITAKAICTIIHKDPHKAVQGNPNKPLSASQKRKQRRFEKQRPPDNVIEYELKEGEGFKIIPNEDYVQPPSVRYVKEGKEMPEGWQPISLESATSPKKLGGQDNGEEVEAGDRAALPAQPGQS